jgi:hypothetical protein
MICQSCRTRYSGNRVSRCQRVPKQSLGTRLCGILLVLLIFIFVLDSWLPEYAKRVWESGCAVVRCRLVLFPPSPTPVWDGTGPRNSVSWVGFLRYTSKRLLTAEKQSGYVGNAVEDSVGGRRETEFPDASGFPNRVWEPGCAVYWWFC